MYYIKHCLAIKKRLWTDYTFLVYTIFIRNILYLWKVDKMSFSLNLGAWNSVFAVPTDIVDKHIKLAGAAQLKVLLWILRHSGENFNLSDVAKSLSMHPADVNDSMQYWIESGIIINENSVLSPYPNNNTMLKELKRSKQLSSEKIDIKTSKSIKFSRPLSRPQKPDSISLAKRIDESSEIAFLMQESQLILGKTLSIGDSATLLMLHDTDGLPVDVIIMLLQYAVTIGKTHMRYIEKLAISWSDEGIDSLEKAEKKIRFLTDSSNAYRTVERITGIEHHSPTASESKFCNTWINDWKFNDELIREAYERCVDNTGKFSFKYTNKILETWFKAGINSIEQALNDKKQNKQKTANQQNTTYDIDAYENSSIFND